MSKNTIEKIKVQFYQIKNTSSKKEKEKLIEQFVKDIDFRMTVKFVYNHYIVTGLSKKKIDKVVPMMPNMLDNIFQVFEYLKKHDTGSDKDIAVVQAFIRQYPEHEEFLKQLFTKDVKIGITETTLNKVEPGLVPEFGVMLAESYDPKHIDGEHFIITTKLDGSRLICIVKNEEVKFYSRQGKEVEGLVEIENEMKNYPNGVYDGELIAKGKFADSKEQFKETMKRSRVKGVKSGLRYVMYDYIENIEDFNNGIDNTPCLKRKTNLMMIFEMQRCTSDVKLEFTQYLYPLFVGNNLGAIAFYAQKEEERGEEGIMINLVHSPYQTKRVNHLLKVKTMKTVDLRVIGMQEGTGKNKGKLGALVVDYKGHEVKVGSGFSDELRQQLWNEAQTVLKDGVGDCIMGKIVEVQYFEETTNKDNGISLRFPVFLHIREDKDEESYN